MLGFITLLIALVVQIGLLVYRLVTKNRQTRIMHIIRLAAFAIFSVLLLTKVYWWGFRWFGLFVLLAVMAVFSVSYFIRKPQKEKEYKGLSVVLSCINGCILLIFCILPGLLFPQFAEVAPTGSYEVATSSYTYLDTSRSENFSATGENRKVSVQFWYPANSNNSETFPLLVFSHGSFGYRGSNLSTYEDLASNGYVVCSIDHSYHAFFAQHTDGSRTLVDMDFLNDAVNITNNAYDEQVTYDKTHEWLDLRTADMNFVLDEILQRAAKTGKEQVYSLINTDKTGLFGHSLGGATAAQLGRDRQDIDAVIVIDGTMIGEELAIANGQKTLNPEPYTLPLLNLYNSDHYAEAHEKGMTYNNISASTKAIEAYDVVIRDSGHLNFTDLPLFSPVLARMLGTGEVDSRYCIEIMNGICRQFFDYTLKDSGSLQLLAEY